MCQTRTIWIPCDKDHNQDGGGVLLATIDTITTAWKAAKFTGRQTVDFAIGLAVIAVWLYRAAAWTAPRVWRLTRTAYRTGRHRWQTRTVVLDRQPVAAVTATPEHVLWSELQLKQEANTR